MIYLDIDIRPFPSTRKNKGYYIFIDRMKEGSANTIERHVLECQSKQEIKPKIKSFIANYKKEYNYLRLWKSTLKTAVVAEVKELYNDIDKCISDLILAAK